VPRIQRDTEERIAQVSGNNVIKAMPGNTNANLLIPLGDGEEIGDYQLIDIIADRGLALLGAGKFGEGRSCPFSEKRPIQAGFYRARNPLSGLSGC
jgi:hypothetical protein